MASPHPFLWPTTPVRAAAQGVSRREAPRPDSQNVLVLSATFPSSADENYGVFVKERMKAVSQLDHYNLRVVAPTPWFPRVPLSTKWSNWSNFPSRETVDGLDVLRPRFPMIPKVGGYLQPWLMRRAARHSIRQLIQEGFRPALIDAHFVFPNGVLGASLAAELQAPFVMTGRGEDILRFPQLPLKRPQILRAIRRCNQFVALSQEIAEAFARLGAPPERITVIPNGVDCDKFRPVDRDAVRRELGLPLDCPIILSVGNRQERKGFHLLVDALAEVRNQFPRAMLVIVGGAALSGSDYTAEIERRMAHHGLEGSVILAGKTPHQELYRWYGAADVFALLSSREGSPNVVLEALACGTPAVATSIGGIPDELADARLGIVLSERTAQSAADGLIAALKRTWDRGFIRRAMLARGWDRVSAAVSGVFQHALDEGPLTVRA